MNERIGYPEFILDPEQLDKKYESVSFFFLVPRSICPCTHLALMSFQQHEAKS